MKIIATTALILGLATSAFAMTPVEDINLHAGSDSEQRMAAVAQDTDHMSGAVPTNGFSDGSDNDQRKAKFATTVISNGATSGPSAFDGDDADQRRLAN